MDGGVARAHLVELDVEVAHVGGDRHDGRRTADRGHAQQPVVVAGATGQRHAVDDEELVAHRREREELPVTVGREDDLRLAAGGGTVGRRVVAAGITRVVEHDVGACVGRDRVFDVRRRRRRAAAPERNHCAEDDALSHGSPLRSEPPESR